VIVTNNVKDFPSKALVPWGLEAKDADTFLLDQISIDKTRVYTRIQQIADCRNHPPTTVAEILVELEKTGLLQSVAVLRV
jgi:hypothetical protein